MPKVIKFDASALSNTRTKGNMRIGANSHDYGNSYYSMIEPPDGGYTVYENKASGGPSIRVANNEAELINLTRESSGTTYASADECLAWFATQNDKVVVSSNDVFDNYISDGLVLELDASNLASYPGSGTTWYDLSGNGFDYDIIGSPSYSEGVFTLTETTGFRASHNITNSTTATVVVFYKTTDGQELWATGQSNSYYIAASYGNNYYQQNAGSPSYYVDTTSVSNPTSYRNGKYHMWEAKNVNLSTWTRMWFWQYGSSWNMNGTVAKIMVYDRALTAAESKQNYYGAVVPDNPKIVLNNKKIFSFENNQWSQNMTGLYSNTNLPSGYISHNDLNGDFDGLTEFTYCLWLKVHNVPVGYSHSAFNKYAGTSTAVVRLYQFGTTSGSSNLFKFYVNGGGGWGDIGGGYYGTNGETFFMVIQYNSTDRGQLWINGQKVGSRAGRSGTIATNSANFYLYPDNGTNTNSTVKEAYVYNHELTDQEIITLFNSTRGNHGI